MGGSNLSVSQSVCLSVRLCVCLSVCLSVDNCQIVVLELTLLYAMCVRSMRHLCLPLSLF